MKKRILGVVLPIAAVGILATTGLGMFVFNSGFDVSPEAVSIGMDSVIVNKDIKVYLNGTKKNSSEPAREGYGPCNPLNKNGAHQYNPIDTKFAFDLDWNITAYIDDLKATEKGSELEWKTLKPQGDIEHDISLPALASPNEDHPKAFYPYSMQMDVTLSMATELTKCMDFTYTRESTTLTRYRDGFTKNVTTTVEQPGSQKASDLKWEYDDPTSPKISSCKFTIDFNNGLETAKTDLNNTSFDSSFYDSASKLRTSYMNKEFIPTVNNEKVVHGFFGGFEAKIKQDTKNYDTAKTDYVALVAQLNAMKNDPNKVDNILNDKIGVKVNRIYLMYAECPVEDDPNGSTIVQSWNDFFEKKNGKFNPFVVEYEQEIYPNLGTKKIV